MASQAARTVQAKKIEVSRATIAKQQYAGRWPEEYVSYSGPVGRNPFKNPQTFFGVMGNRPEKYTQRFTFLPIGGAAGQLRNAAVFAVELLARQAWKYGVDTGLYSRSFALYIREGGTRRRTTNLADLDSAGEETVFEVTNAVAYASTVESNALNIARIGGVLYFVAQQVKRQFPGLGVRYVYQRAETFGFGHKYDAPVLTIGSRRVVRDRLVRPGKNYRRRERRRRATR